MSEANAERPLQEQIPKVHDQPCANPHGHGDHGVVPERLAGPADGSEGLVSGLMELLIDSRQKIRAEKLWSLSDAVRDGLKNLGITLEDKKDGTTWMR